MIDNLIGLYICLSAIYIVLTIFFQTTSIVNMGLTNYIRDMEVWLIIANIIFIPSLTLLILVLLVIEFIYIKPKIFSWLFKKPFKK